LRGFSIEVFDPFGNGGSRRGRGFANGDSNEHAAWDAGDEAQQAAGCRPRGGFGVAGRFAGVQDPTEGAHGGGGGEADSGGGEGFAIIVATWEEKW